MLQCGTIHYYKKGFRIRCKVMAPFAYHESHQAYYTNPELIRLTAQVYIVLQKLNRVLNAT